MNRWTPWIVGSLCLATMAACSGNRGNNSGAGDESGSMQGGAAGTVADTGLAGGAAGDTAAGTRSSATGGESTDTARSGVGSDPAKGNQTKSGVTDTKTGKSTLGKGVTQTSPDQGQPVTAKGDTVRPPNDSTAVGQQ